MKRRYWTTTEVREFRRLYPDTTNAALGATFGRTRSAINQMATKLGIKKSAAFVAQYARWPRGLVPWNKGKHWNPPGSRATQFKKGHRGARQKPVGTERRERDGIMVKVAEPSVWVPKARVVWERHFGSIPDGALVRFKDGDRENFDPANLRLITRGEHVVLNWRPKRPKPKPATWAAPLKNAA